MGRALGSVESPTVAELEAIGSSDVSESWTNECQFSARRLNKYTSTHHMFTHLMQRRAYQIQFGRRFSCTVMLVFAA